MSLPPGVAAQGHCIGLPGGGQTHNFKLVLFWLSGAAGKKVRQACLRVLLGQGLQLPIGVYASHHVSSTIEAFDIMIVVSMYRDMAACTGYRMKDV